MEKIGILFSVLLIIVTLFYAIQTGSPNTQSIPTTPAKTTAPPTVKKTVTTTITNSVTTIPVSSTSQVTQNPEVNNNGIIEYRSSEKIINPEDLQAGDLIQMSISDPRFDKEHGFIIENIFPQNNQFLIKEIVRFKSDNVVRLKSFNNFTGDLQWIGIGTQNPRLITSGALMRDYPYKIGHASQPLQQLCLGCPPGIEHCNDDEWRLRDCQELKKS